VHYQQLKIDAHAADVKASSGDILPLPGLNGTTEPCIDVAIGRLIENERLLQATTINLIAAANYLSPGVAAAMSPMLEAIHSEGYRGSRYHEGQATADAIEGLAIERACQLFAVDHANVQPYRGTMANLAACVAVMKPGESLMGLCTAAGGHYTTGSELHLIGQLFKVIPYDVDTHTCSLDYDRIAALARAHHPRVIFCGDTAYPRRWDYAALRHIADTVGAVLIADISQVAGMIAGGTAPNPASEVDVMTSATYKTLRGPRAGLILSKAEYARAIDRAVYPICQGGTNVRVLSGIAAALGEAGTESFRAYIARVLENSRVLADVLASLGFDLVTGGTDNHACLIDVRPLGVTGDVAAAWLAASGILANANQIPHDMKPPRHPSGLRLGSAAVTTLGADRNCILEIAGLVARVLRGGGSAELSEAVRELVTRLRSHLPYLSPDGDQLAQV
jgi:glycine hydroxymethyltransferase